MTLISLSPNVFSLIGRCIYFRRFESIFCKQNVHSQFDRRISNYRFPFGNRETKFNQIRRQWSPSFESFLFVEKYIFLCILSTNWVVYDRTEFPCSFELSKYFDKIPSNFLCFIILGQMFQTFVNKNKNLELQIQGWNLKVKDEQNRLSFSLFEDHSGSSCT